MIIELNKNDYEQLHENILKEAIKGKNKRDALKFDYYKEVCFLDFNRKGKPKKIILNHNAYISEGEFKTSIQRCNSNSKNRTKMAEYDADVVRLAQMGERYSMAELGMTNKDAPFKRY